MEQDLITIVVPVYKVEQYLNRCVNSIVNQSYQNLEIILVDDGSPDNCPKMCDGWAKKDSRIRVIHKKNAGLGMARNTGIEHASGTYICFFDSDDYIALDTIEKAHTLAAAEHAEVVLFGMNNVDSSGVVTARGIPESEKSVYFGTDVQNIVLPDLIDSRHNAVKIKNLCLSACSCLFAAELIHRTGWRFLSERQNISEDSYALIWLFKYVNTVAILHSALYFYCENNTSLTRIYREDRYDKIKQFYFDCSHLASKSSYNHEIHTRIKGLFLSFSIAAMKQIAVANIGREKRRILLSQIIHDSTMQEVLLDAHFWNNNRARQLLFWAMRKKYLSLVAFMVRMQASKKA